MESVTTAGRCARGVIACGLVLAAAGCGDSTPVGIAGPTTGVLQVTVSTSGADLPTNGYTVSVDSGAGHLVPVNGKVSLAGLSVGSHSVAMYGAPPNCALSGANTRAVEVLAGDTALVVFDVACTVIGPIVFASNRDGYPFQIYAMNADGSHPSDSLAPASTLRGRLTAGRSPSPEVAASMSWTLTARTPPSSTTADTNHLGHPTGRELPSRPRASLALPRFS